MFAIIFSTFLPKEFLSMFVENKYSACDPDLPIRWPQISEQWVISIICAAFLSTMFMCIIKTIRKKRVKREYGSLEKHWNLTETTYFVLFGAAPMTGISLLIWSQTPPFRICIGISGFVVGAFSGMLLYLVLMFIMHLLIKEWARETFNRE